MLAGMAEPAMSEGARTSEQEPPAAVSAQAPAPAATVAATVIQLQRTVGNRATQRLLQRYTVHAITVCRPGDTLPISIRASYKDPDDKTWSGRFPVDGDGFVTFDNGQRRLKVRIGGLELVDAASRIADEFYDQGVFIDPSVTVTSVDGYAAAGSGSAKAGLNNQLQKYKDYAKGIVGESDAVQRYQKWIDEHRSANELGATTPAEVWGAALKPPPGPDPRDAKINEFVTFMSDEWRRDQEIKDPDERNRAVESMLRFQDWFERNKEARGFLKRDPAKVYADLWVQVLKEEIDRKVKRDLEIAKQKALDEAEPDELRKKKWDEFYALAMNLWGYSGRTYPYRIPMPSEGKHILVWGQPGVQDVLNKAANDLMSWATDHMFETGYTKVSPRSVLADVMKAGKYGDALKDAQKKPLDHETIDRNEIVPEKALAAFGETVATGLLVVAVVAVVVGA